MSLYSYKAKDKKGKVVEDVVQATSKSEAASIVTSNDLKILTVRNLDGKFGASIGGKIKIAEKASFCRFMATMLRAGLPLPEAIDNIRQETKNDKLKKILYDVSFQTRKGSSLSSILSKYKKDFDTFFLTMIKAGEASGTVDESFDYLSKQLLASYELQQKVKGAMIYPIVIIVAMLANFVVMIVFVLPKLSDVFLQLNVEIPFATRMLLSFGSFVGKNTFLSLGIFAVMGVAAFLILKIDSTRHAIFKLMTYVPAIHRLIVNIDVARFSRTLSTMLHSGVPITVALEVSGDTLSNPKFIKTAEKFSEGVSQGEQLSELLVRGGKIFPAAMIQTVRAGEKSGSLEEVLEELAEFYEKEVDYSLKSVTSLIEPILMLVIGLAVGAMVLMMVTPIYSLVGGFDSSF